MSTTVRKKKPNRQHALKKNVLLQIADDLRREDVLTPTGLAAIFEKHGRKKRR